MSCRQHGQCPRGCVLQLVVILPAEQHYQLQPVIPISQEPLLYLWWGGGFTWLREKCPHLPAWKGKEASEAMFSDPKFFRAFF